MSEFNLIGNRYSNSVWKYVWPYTSIMFCLGYGCIIISYLKNMKYNSSKVGKPGYAAN